MLRAPWWPLALLLGVAAGPYVAAPFRADIAEVSGKKIVGQARIVDGDTLDIDGTRIRLHGIDAPESDQSCRVNGAISRCGDMATSALEDWVGNHPVVCEPKGRDHYGRVIAICDVGGENMNAWMVANGWALAYRRYSSRYILQEWRASLFERGMWQGDFVPPWEWRRGKRL